MADNLTRTQEELAMEADLGETLSLEDGQPERSEKRLAILRLLWERRHFLLRMTIAGLVLATLIAFLIPKRYTAYTQLMPPDSQSGTGLAMLASLAGKAGPSGGSLASSFLEMKTSGTLFIGVLQSRTIQEHLVNKFGLRKVYGDSKFEDARGDLARGHPQRSPVGA